MKKITFILFALFTCWQINAQVSAYSFSETTETYAQITGTTSTATGDDGTQTNIPIGFTFNYGGINYTAFGISTNGIIRLGSNATDTAIATGWTNGLSNTAGNRPLIAPLWDDNHLGAGTIRYAVTGSSPNQVLTVNFHNTKIGGGGTNGGADVSTIIRLYETTNVIEIVYSNPFTTVNAVSASVGLNDASSFLSVTPAATSTVSSATANNAINAATMANLAGKKLTFSPPSCFAPSGFVASNLTLTTATISWNAANPVPSTGYEYFYSTVNTAPSGAGTPINALTDNLSGLAPNTTHYVWLRSDCGGTFSTWVGPFTFFTGYCIPSSTSSSSYVDNFTTSGGSQNISNLASGFTAGGYLNASAQVVESYETGSFDFNATIVGGTVGFAIWIDWNNNLIFEAGEKVYNTTAYGNGPFSGTITVPGGTALGNYRMRITTDYNSSNPSNPCAAAARAESEDYTVTVGNPPACLVPNTIIASNITSNSVDLSWTDGSGGLQFDYEYAIQAPGTGIPTGAGAPINDVTVLAEGFDINGNPLTANTLYEVYVRADCGGGSFSTWSGPITFRTLCSTFVAPYTEGFENAGTIPSCWNMSGSENWLFSNAPGFNHIGNNGVITGSTTSGGYFAWVDDSTPDTTNATLTSPMIDVAALTVPRLTFFELSNNEGANPNSTLNVEVWDGAAWNPMATYNTNTNGWEKRIIDLSSLTITGNIQVRFIIVESASFYDDIAIDDVTIEESPSTAPSCASNIVATPNASCGNFSNTITWDATSGANGYYLTIGTTSGGTDVLNNSDIGSTVSYSFTGTIGTTYFYKLVPYNAIGSATGCTEQSFTTNASGCYCVSAPTSVDGTGITNVQLVATNFANTVSTAPVYNDHTATVVDMSQGINNNVQISFDTGFGYDYNIVIWIDANNDYVLDASEIVYTGLVPNTPIITHNASFVMPATMPLGQHRMRIIATDDLQTPANPCYSGSYGETADFTVNVVAATCTPPAATTSIVPACGTAQFSIDVNVTALGSGTPSISNGTTTWPVSAIGVVNVGPFASGSSVTLTLLHGSDVTCNLPLGTLTYSCPPANDDCANAIALTPGAVFGDNDIVGTNAAATASAGETAPGCASYLGGDVWYSAVVPASGSLTFELNTSVGGITDGAGAVYSGTCGSLVLLGCNDSASSDPNDQPLVTVTGRTPGEVLYFRVWEYGNNAFGTFLVSTYDASLSSGSFDNANFSAYPNPVKDVLNVSYTSDISSVKIINMLGQEVISKNINATSSQIDMSQLSAGTYIVNVTVGDTIKTLKVVKQ